MRQRDSVSQSRLVPQVVRETHSGDRALDVFSRLLTDRIVLLGETVMPEVANLVMAQLLHLEAEDPDKDVALYINAPGGDPMSALAIIDTMAYVRCDVATFCFGQAADVAAVLLAAGAPSKRLALEHARVVLSQPQAELQGQSVDIETHAREVLRVQALLVDVLAERTDRKQEDILTDTDRELVLTATDARDYGIVDSVIERRPES